MWRPRTVGRAATEGSRFFPAAEEGAFARQRGKKGRIGAEGENQRLRQITSQAPSAKKSFPAVWPLSNEVFGETVTASHAEREKGGGRGEAKKGGLGLIKDRSAQKGKANVPSKKPLTSPPPPRTSIRCSLPPSLCLSSSCQRRTRTPIHSGSICSATKSAAGEILLKRKRKGLRHLNSKKAPSPTEESARANDLGNLILLSLPPI